MTGERIDMVYTDYSNNEYYDDVRKYGLIKARNNADFRAFTNKKRD